MKKKLQQHPLSAAYPAMAPEEFQIMQDSIGAAGVHTPIVLLDGMVLDGWHRWRIADGYGMDCPMREFGSLPSDGDDPGQFVKDMNSARRHLNAGQRALAEAEVQRIMAQRGVTSAPGAPQNRLEAVAESAGVSRRTAAQAQAVAKNATPAVKEAVKDGVISLKKAVQIAKLPKKKQKKAITEPPAPPQRPAWRPTTATPMPRPVVGASVEAMDELKERIAILVEENDRLNDRLAVACAENASDEERALYAATLGELRREVELATAKLTAVTESRDALLTENNELRKQCAMYRNQLQKHRVAA